MELTVFKLGLLVPFAGLGQCLAQSTFPHWPRHTVQWSHQATLQDLLKAGVKVKHFNVYDTDIILTIKNAWISFQHPDQEPLPYFPVDYAEIYLYTNYELASIDVSGYPQSVDEGNAMVEKWRIHAKETSLDQWHLINKTWKAITGNGGSLPANFGEARHGFGLKISPVPDFKPVQNETFGPGAGFGFANSYDRRKPLLPKYHASWSSLKPHGMRTYMSAPPKPPPGWEHLDFTVKRVQFLDSVEARKFHQAVTDPNAVWEEPPRTPAVAPAENAPPIPDSQPAPAPAPPRKTPDSEDKSTVWWKWLLVLVAVGLAARQAYYRHIENN